MLTLFYSPGACSLASHIALREAGADFTPHRVSLAKGEHKTPEYLAINPHARVPALKVDETVVTENVAIISLIGRWYPASGLIPTDDMAAARAVELLAFFSSSVHVAFAHIFRPERYIGEEAGHEAVRQAGRRLVAGYLDEIERLAAGGTYIEGTFSAADLYPFVMSRWAGRAGFDLNAYPAWKAHTARVLERPAVQAALAEEGLGAPEFLPAAAA
jgi:glutathione S-transferase